MATSWVFCFLVFVFVFRGNCSSSSSMVLALFPSYRVLCFGVSPLHSFHYRPDCINYGAVQHAVAQDLASHFQSGRYSFFPTCPVLAGKIAALTARSCNQVEVFCACCSCTRELTFFPFLPGCKSLHCTLQHRAPQKTPVYDHVVCSDAQKCTQAPIHTTSPLTHSNPHILLTNLLTLQESCHLK